MDIQLHYAEWGQGEPLILLHGNGEDSSYFVHQVPFLQNDFRVIALDTRWHGRSPRGTAPFTLNQFAEDLLDFMDELGIETAHLLGFSDGANIALLFAMNHPDCVLSLVLNGGNLFPEGLEQRVRDADAREYEAAIESGDERTQLLLRLMMDEPRIDPADLSALTMPALVVAGTDDMICERHTRLIANSIPGAQLEFIEGDHFVAMGNPAEFNRVLYRFYQGLAGK